MSNTARLSQQAVGQLDDLPREVARYIVKGIAERLPQAGQQMIVKGMTCCLPDHIYRVFKFYAYRPGHRVIFHFIAPNVIMIDSVCRRDCDPYGDGR
jgi:hypothetical protein